jgi:peptidyl-prolyl cis-trans isomerase C
MRQTSSKLGWRRDPLVHFALLGAALFALHGWLAPPPRDAATIVVSRPLLDGLRREHLQRTGSSPTGEEEAALIDRYVDSEILYREALAQGLDRGDIIVRRRLVQKMEFVLETLAPLPEPTEAELQEFLDTHAERYELAARATLSHVFVSSERHGNAAEGLAAALRARLVAGEEASVLGEPFLHGRRLGGRTPSEIAAVFGQGFAEHVARLRLDEWSLPIESSYGFHVVRVTERVPRRRPPLDEIRSLVQRDWEVERRTALTRSALQRLRNRYEILAEASPAERIAALQ